MSTSQVGERWDLLRSKGGPSAAAFWLIRQTLRLDLFRVLSVHLDRCPAATLRQGCRFMVIRSEDDVGRCDAQVLASLDQKSGSGVAASILAGGRIYALVGETGVLCQLKIDTLISRTDTPCDLTVQLPERESFLSFLYTAPEARRARWASHLLALTGPALSNDGFSRCHCHVQATNVRSLRTFTSAGWQPSGWIAATPSRQFLGSWTGRGSNLRFESGIR